MNPDQLLNLMLFSASSPKGREQWPVCETCGSLLVILNGQYKCDKPHDNPLFQKQ